MKNHPNKHRKNFMNAYFLIVFKHRLLWCQKCHENTIFLIFVTATKLLTVLGLFYDLPFYRPPQTKVNNPLPVLINEATTLIRLCSKSVGFRCFMLLRRFNFYWAKKYNAWCLQFNSICCQTSRPWSFKLNSAPKLKIQNSFPY
jgi:hypothetical protein